MSGCGKHWSWQIPLTFFLLVKKLTVIFSLRMPLNSKLHFRSLVDDEAEVQTVFGGLILLLSNVHWVLGLSVTVDFGLLGHMGIVTFALNQILNDKVSHSTLDTYVCLPVSLVTSLGQVCIWKYLPSWSLRTQHLEGPASHSHSP